MAHAANDSEQAQQADQDWIQLSLQSGEFSPDQLEEALLSIGALAVTLQNAGQQPILEPLPGTMPLWRKTRVTGLFNADSDIAVLRRKLRALFGDRIVAACRLENLTDRDWVRAWLDDFEPLCFGERLWVIPSGYQAPDENAVNLLLDPGLAFGTGTHPTTALCLEWLEQTNLNDKTVLDFGCGSGILAIAAARLGARVVHAVDIDPQALLACKQNAARNKVNITISEPAALAAQQVDILIANILAGPLIDLAETLAALIRRNGQLVLSGLLSAQADKVQNAYQPWFDFAPQQMRENWCLLSAVRIIGE